MKVIHARDEGTKVEKRSESVTGDVWGDPILPTTDGVLINSVHFGPCSRTYWHSHEGGQVLEITSGTGWVATRDGAPTKVRKGDTIWTPPGEDHWHGSDDDTFLVHVAISMGKTTWKEEVSQAEYESSTAGSR